MKGNIKMPNNDASDKDVEIMKRYMDVYCDWTQEPEGSDIQAEAIKAVEAINARLSDKMKAFIRQHTHEEDQNPYFPTILVVSQALFDLGLSTFPPHARYQDDSITEAGYNNLVCSNFILVSPNPR